MNSARKLTILTGLGAAAVLSLVIFCGIQIPKLSTRYSVRQFFPINHSVLKTDEQITHEFDLKDGLSVYVYFQIPKSENGTWLESARMRDLEKMTKDLAGLPGAESAVSLASVPMASTSKTELRIGTLSETTNLKNWPDTVDHQPLLKGQLISDDHRSALVIIIPKGLSSAKQSALTKGVQKIQAKYRKYYQSGMAGMPAVQTRLTEKLESEMGRFLFLSLAVFIFTFAVFYRNISAIVFVAGGLVICNICILGLLSLEHVSFTVLLSTLPIILSITFVSLAIHTLHLWADRLKEAHAVSTSERVSLLWPTFKEILLPNLLGSLTTAIGFGALATTSIPAIRDYAVVVAASVLLTFVLAHFYMALTLVWITPMQRSWIQGSAQWTRWVTRHALLLFVGIFILCGAGSSSATRLNFSSRLFDDLPRNEAIRTNTTHIDQKFGGTIALDIAIDSGVAHTWMEPDALKRLAYALAQIRKVEGVGSALGVTDFFEKSSYSSKSKASEAYFLYSMSPENPLRHFVDNNLRQTRFALRLRDLPSNQVDKIRAQVRQIITHEFPLSYFPKGQISEGGLAVTSHTINREVSKDLVFGFWQSLMAIGLILVLIFRSLRWALLACLPNLVAPAVLMGAMALFHTPIKPAIGLIFSIALGLSFNNTVYLLSRLRRRLSEIRGFAKPLRLTLLEEGNPCLSESILMLAGFLIFLSSDFKLNQTFGAYMVLSVLAGALGDLFFLPAVLQLFPRLLYSPKNRPQSAIMTIDSSNSSSSKTRIAASWAGAILIVMAGAIAPAAADEGAELLKQSRKNIEAKTDQASVVLTTREANGDKKVRKIQLKTMRDGGTYHALARVEGPADIKGTALLAEIKDGNENQWLYLPASHQVRRVVSGKKSSGVLGSELSPEDLNSTALKGASEKLLKKEVKSATVEIKPIKGSSQYSRIVVTLALPLALPLKTEYYIGSKLTKRVEFKDYITLGPLHRARHLIVHNLENGRSTVVDFSHLVVNQKFEADDFSEAALQNAD